MTKHRKWLSICLVICLIGGLGGGIWYRNKKIEERKLSLIYIPKVVDGTNDFWKSVILGAKMAAMHSKQNHLLSMFPDDLVFYKSSSHSQEENCFLFQRNK